MSQESTKSANESRQPLFCTTHWSVVMAAGQPESPEAMGALEALCRAYWRPVYAHVRRQGHPSEMARDLTQEFFARLLAGQWLRTADPQRGRFRSFLLRCLSRFLVDEWRRATAQKRGGGQIFFSLDDSRAEDRCLLEPADESNPEKAFDRKWAESVIAHAMARLRAVYEDFGQRERFEMLKVYLQGDCEPASYAEVAAHLGLTVPAVKSAIHTLRQRFAEAIRATIAETLSRVDDVEQELEHLLAALSE